MTPDTMALRRLAEAATPGPWRHFHHATSGTNAVKHDGRTDIVAWQGFDDSDRKEPRHAANAEYIAACDPQTILALLDRLDALEKVAEAAQRALTAYDDKAHWPVRLTTMMNLLDRSLARIGRLDALEAVAEAARRFDGPCSPGEAVEGAVDIHNALARLDGETA